MKEKLKKISEFEYDIPKTGSMKVPGKIFISETMLKNVEENALQQIVNVANLSGIQKYSLAMPDLHSGYGFPIGGVAAFDLKTGVISPGGVGYDINCGVRLLATNIKVEDFLKIRKEVLHDLYRSVPSGVGRGRKERLSEKELDEVLKLGVEWAVKNGFAVKGDLKTCEENGRLKNANPEYVSDRAKKRGLSQLGTLGAGNHFLEIQKVGEVYDEKIVKQFGIDKDCICIMIHCGSRGLGHQVASDYIKAMEQEYGFKDLPDRELINAPIDSELGKRYLSAMNCAVNFAFCNRQVIMHYARSVLERHFSKSKSHLVYDVCHNVAKIEEHQINGKKKKVCIHRKGATRSFGPGRIEIPQVYRKIGQPVLIPGSMGTSSYVLVGTKKAEQVSFGSTAHGAGRVMSRHEALRKFRGEEVKKKLEAIDVEIEAGGWKSIAEEAPGVYKDIDDVVNVSHKVGIGNLVVKLKPLAVMKG
jgi:tRNA-splicing ligase RtcB